MSFAQLFAILRGRWVIACAVFVAVTGVVATLTLMAPRQYTAVGSIVLDIKSPDPILGTLPGVASPSYLLTQIDIIRSMRVARRVVNNLRMTESPEIRAQWMESTGGAGSPETWLAAALLSNLEVRPSRGSNVMNVIYTAGEPRFAAAVANGFIDAYMSVTTELRTDPAKEFSRFFDANAKQLREKVEEAQAKLSSFQQKNGLVVTDERLDVETARLQALSTQLVMLQAEVAESGSRQAQAAMQGDKMQEVFANPMYSGLKAELARQESTLEQLSQRLGDAHPQVKEQRALVTDLRAKATAEVGRVASGLSINNSVNQTRVAKVRAALDDQRATVLKLRATRDEAAVLQRDAENAQRAYDAVLARLNVTSLESKGVQANVSPLEYATEPARHSSPRVGVNMFLGAALALALGIAAALMAEFRDRRLRLQSEVESLVLQPLLGAVPAFSVGNRTGHAVPHRFRLSTKTPTRGKDRP
ncbi:MAG: chain length determinant protein EpsF [Burkholderiales bacterium]|nr:chain length determinant protein EpsF [Burkholderiales bacterium]